MVAYLQADVRSDLGLIKFKVIKPVETETIVSDKRMSQSIVNYPVGAIIEGYPAMVMAYDMETKQPISEQPIEGVLIEKDNGVVLVPIDSVTDELDQAESVDESSGIIQLPKDGVLGFTYKQLLFLGLFTLIITKIVKN